MLKPALSNIYVKISNKTESHAKIFVSKAVMRDLHWFGSHVSRSDRVYLFQDVDWSSEQADVITYSDACLSGLGFFFKHSKRGFQCIIPRCPPKDTIFYFEVLAVVSVVHAVTLLPTVPP